MLLIGILAGLSYMTFLHKKDLDVAIRQAESIDDVEKSAKEFLEPSIEQTLKALGNAKFQVNKLLMQAHDNKDQEAVDLYLAISQHLRQFEHILKNKIK